MYTHYDCYYCVFMFLKCVHYLIYYMFNQILFYLYSYLCNFVKFKHSHHLTTLDLLSFLVDFSSKDSLYEKGIY